MKTLEELKETLSSIEGKRDVERWNNLREQAKDVYSKEVISELDASGFIKQWLKNEFHISSNGWH